jgi:hypothetical protein
MEPNTDMAQSKLLIDLLLGDCWRRKEKLTLIFLK